MRSSFLRPLQSATRCWSPQAVELDGSGQALTDAGVAFEALHLAPRLTVTAGGGGHDSDPSDSSSSSTSSSSGGDSSDSSDEDETGGLDLLGPPVKVAGRPGAPPTHRVAGAAAIQRWVTTCIGSGANSCKPMTEHASTPSLTQCHHPTLFRIDYRVRLDSGPR